MYKLEFWQNLLLIGDNISNGYFPASLDFLSILVVFCGIVVIISKNPVISIIFLIGLFSGIASYLITLGLSFIGLSYVIIYVGAVSILFLFILMLIDIRISELENYSNNSILLSIIIGIPLLSFLYLFLPSEIPIINKRMSFSLNKILINNVPFVSSYQWDANLASEINHITNIGNIIYTNYNLLLILTSLILLLTLTGAIIIVIKPNRSG